MKNLILIFLCIASFSISCSKKVEYNYKVELFCREDESIDGSSGISGLELKLNKLKDEGWEYEGVICSNGMNCNYIAFKKEK